MFGDLKVFSKWHTWVGCFLDPISRCLYVHIYRFQISPSWKCFLPQKRQQPSWVNVLVVGFADFTAHAGTRYRGANNQVSHSFTWFVVVASALYMYTHYQTIRVNVPPSHLRNKWYVVTCGIPLQETKSSSCNGLHTCMVRFIELRSADDLLQLGKARDSCRWSPRASIMQFSKEIFGWSSEECRPGSRQGSSSGRPRTLGTSSPSGWWRYQDKSAVNATLPCQLIHMFL